MDTNALVRKIIAEFKELEQRLLQRDLSQWRNTEWTRKVLTTLCKLGRELGYTAYAKGDPEWLYDVIWCNSDTSDTYERLISVPMVAECEWGDWEKIAYDFEKLLVARATVRVMVYSAWYAKDEDEPAEFINNKLLKHVHTFNGVRGDTYLLIANVGDVSDKWFEFAQIVDQGPGNPPTLQTL